MAWRPLTLPFEVTLEAAVLEKFLRMGMSDYQRWFLLQLLFLSNCRYAHGLHVCLGFCR